MTSNPAPSVQTANRLILACVLFRSLLFTLLSLFEPLPEGLEWFLAISGTAILSAVFFRQAVREFCQDSRFRTPPRWTSVLILTGLFLAMSLGLVIFVVTLLSWFPDYFENLETLYRTEEGSGTFDRLLEFVAVAII